MVFEFRWGVVSSAKTADLLIRVHQEKVSDHSKKPVVMKPAAYVRDGKYKVGSRIGLECTADYVIGPNDPMPSEDIILAADSISGVYVDESHMLTKEQIEQLADIALHVDVHCYGLRTDFRNDMFEGSIHLMRLPDKITEVVTKCHYCDRKASCNLKLRDGRGTISRDEPQIEEGFEDMYLPVCYSCFKNKTKAA